MLCQRLLRVLTIARPDTPKPTSEWCQGNLTWGDTASRLQLLFVALVSLLVLAIAVAFSLTQIQPFQQHTGDEFPCQNPVGFMDRHVFCDYFRPTANPKFGLLIPKLNLLSGFMEVRARLLPKHPQTQLELSSIVNISTYRLRTDYISGTRLRVFTETGLYDQSANTTLGLEAPSSTRLTKEDGQPLGYDIRLAYVTPVPSTTFLTILQYPADAPEFDMLRSVQLYVIHTLSQAITFSQHFSYFKIIGHYLVWLLVLLAVVLAGICSSKKMDKTPLPEQRQLLILSFTALFLENPLYILTFHNQNVLSQVSNTILLECLLLAILYHLLFSLDIDYLANHQYGSVTKILKHSYLIVASLFCLLHRLLSLAHRLTSNDVSAKQFKDYFVAVIPILEHSCDWLMGGALLYVIFCGVVTGLSWKQIPCRTKLLRLAVLPLILVYFTGIFNHSFNNLDPSNHSCPVLYATLNVYLLFSNIVTRPAKEASVAQPQLSPGTAKW